MSIRLISLAGYKAPVPHYVPSADVPVQAAARAIRLTVASNGGPRKLKFRRSDYRSRVIPIPGSEAVDSGRKKKWSSYIRPKPHVKLNLGRMRVECSLRGLPMAQFRALLGVIRDALPPRAPSQERSLLAEGTLCVPLRALQAFLAGAQEVIPDLYPELSGSSSLVREWLSQGTRKETDDEFRARLEGMNVLPEGLRLYPHQLSGLKFLCELNGRALVADDMGLGKTIVAAVYAKMHWKRCGPAVVMCPNSISFVWQNELQKWFPEASTHVVKGGDEVLPNVDFTIVPYHVAANLKKRSRWEGDGGLWRALMRRGFKLGIYDEVHSIRNAESAKCKAALLLSKEIDRRILLSGTPVVNNTLELYVYLRLLMPTGGPKTRSMPLMPVSYERFVKLFGHNDRMIPDLKVLMNSFTLRRTKDEIDLGLPEKRRAYVAVDVSDAEEAAAGVPGVGAKLRRDIKKTVDRYGPAQRYTEHLERKRLSVVSMMKQTHLGVDFLGTHAELHRTALERQRRSTLDRIFEDVHRRTRRRTPEQLRKWGRATFAREHRTRWQRESQVFFDMFCNLRRQVALMKVPAVYKFCMERLSTAGGKPLVVFAHHSDMLMFLNEAFKTHGLRTRLFHGMVTPEQRSEVVADFGSGEVDVLLATFLTAREGLTLVRGSEAVFAERAFSPAFEAQAEDRLYRIGQQRDVTVHYFHALRTIDEYFLRLVHSKDHVFSDLFVKEAVDHHGLLAAARGEVSGVTGSEEPLQLLSDGSERGGGSCGGGGPIGWRGCVVVVV